MTQTAMLMIGGDVKTLAVRHVAKKHNEWTDRACGVLDNGRNYYMVESYEGKVVWEGDAHCRYCARAEAILHHSAKDEAA